MGHFCNNILPISPSHQHIFRHSLLRFGDLHDTMTFLSVRLVMAVFHCLSDKQQGYLFTFITMCIWGAFGLMARMNAYWHIQIWDVLLLRFGIAAAVLLPILWWKKDYQFLFDFKLLILALVGSIGYCIFVYSGFFYAPVAHGVVFLNGTFPLFAALIGYIMLRSPIDRQTGIGLSIIVMTLLLMTISIIIGDGYFGRGDLMFIASGLCWGLFSVLLRKWNFSAWHIMCGVAIWSAVIYSLIYAMFITPAFHTALPTHLAIQGIFHGIFVVIIATLTYAKAVAKIGIFKAGSIANLAPFIASIIAVPLLDEMLNTTLVMGLIGMAIGALQPWRWFIGR